MFRNEAPSALVMAAILDFMHFQVKQTNGFSLNEFFISKNILLDTDFVSLWALDQKLLQFDPMGSSRGGHLGLLNTLNVERFIFHWK